MHTPIKVLIERFCDESKTIQEKYGHFMNILGHHPALDAELFQMKRQDYAGQLKTDLTEVMDRYRKIAHHDSHSDQDKLNAELLRLQEEHYQAFLARYKAKTSGEQLA